MISLTARLVRTAATTGALLCIGATSAHATPGGEPSPLRPADRAAAAQAAGSDRGLDLARRVATLGAKGDSLASRGEPRVVNGTTTQVNVLARDFVASGQGPVGRLGYVATTVRVDDQLVSVWSAPEAKGGPWKAVNAATGDLEARMARKAGGGSLLSEPQVNAWYSVEDGRVRPLNAEARDVVGHAVTLEAYQEIVHDRYADKLPGSEYAESGTAGGYGAPTAAAPSDEGGSGQVAVLGGLSGAGVVSAAGVLVVRRRRARG